MDKGYIKMYRKFKESFLYNDSQAVHLWVHLLLSVNYKDKDLLVSGNKITIKKGSMLTSRQSLERDTKINQSKIQRLLKLFESEQLIEQQTNNKNRIISITNWDLYQQSEQLIEQQVNSKRTAGEQQVNTNNKEKKGKKDKKEKNKQKENGSLFDDEFEKIWEMYEKKGNRKRSMSKWQSLKVEDKRKAMDHIPRYVKSTPEIKYRKNLETYLNNECWNDKIISGKCNADDEYISNLKKQGELF